MAACTAASTQACCVKLVILSYRHSEAVRAAAYRCLNINLSIAMIQSRRHYVAGRANHCLSSYMLDVRTDDGACGGIPCAALYRRDVRLRIRAMAINAGSDWHHRSRISRTAIYKYDRQRNEQIQ